MTRPIIPAPGLVPFYDEMNAVLQDAQDSLDTHQTTITTLTPGLNGLVAGGPNGPASRQLRAVLPNPGLSRLRKFHVALANASAAPCDILTIGDSLSMGSLLAARSDRWVNKLVALLRTKYQPAGVTGGQGYLPAFYSGGYFTSFATTGTINTVATNGLSLQAIKITNGTATITFTGTSARVFYSKGGSGGAFTITVDAGTPINGNCNGVASTGYYLDTVPLSSGSHTLVVATSAAAFLEGAMFFDGDESVGIRLWDGARSGSTSGDYASPSNFWQASVAVIQPDLVTICLGTNDLAASVSVATYKTNMQTIIASVKAACTIEPSIVVLVPPYPVITDNASYPDVPYLNAMYELIDSDPNLLILDMTQRFGKSAAALGLMNGDNIHPNALGNTFQARAMDGYLSPR